MQPTRDELAARLAVIQAVFLGFATPSGVLKRTLATILDIKEEMIGNEMGKLSVEGLIRHSGTMLVPNRERMREARAEFARIIGEQQCRACGCCQSWGCPEGCYWVEPDLCSCCKDKGAAQ